MRVLGWIFAGLLSFCVLFGLGWVVAGNNFFLYKVFAPLNEQVRRETYEQTKSYRQGSVQRLDTLCTQVSTADGDHKPMLNSIIAQEFVEWNTGDVPSYLQSCLGTARR